MIRVRAFSPSRLQVYQTCARRYYYQYVIKVPRRRAAEQSVGISLHSALEEVQKAGGVGETGLAGALALLWDRWESEGFATPEDEARARAQAQALLAEYLEKWGDGPGKPVLIEQALEAEVADVPFLGIVDRVDRLPDGSLELIDYKSGKQRELTPAVRQQLAIYRHLVREKLGEYPAKVTIHHLAANTRVGVELEPGEWKAVLDRAVESARAIRVEADFDPQVGSWCRYCDYNHRCLAYSRSRASAR